MVVIQEKRKLRSLNHVSYAHVVRKIQGSENKFLAPKLEEEQLVRFY